MSTPTCASCKHIGVSYWNDGFDHSHHCKKSDIRRAETMPASADFFTHFRASFDACANQKACRHYEERPAPTGETLALLEKLGNTDAWVELKFMTEENRLAEHLVGKFLQEHNWAPTTTPGHRVYSLLPVGKSELKRALGQ